MREWTDEDRERERCQPRLKWERDQMAFIDEALEIGVEKGEWIGRIHLCEKLLKMPGTPKAELGALEIEVLQRRAKALEEQFGITQE